MTEPAEQRTSSSVRQCSWCVHRSTTIWPAHRSHWYVLGRTATPHAM